MARAQPIVSAAIKSRSIARSRRRPWRERVTVSSRVETPDRNRIADALRDEFAVAYGPRIVVAAEGDLRGGFANILVKVALSGEDLPPDWPAAAVVRVHPTSEFAAKAEREHAVLDFCRTAGYPAVRALHSGSLLGLPYLLVEFVDARESTVDVVRPWRRGRACETLADLLVRLHGLPAAGWPRPDDVRTAARWLDQIRGATADRPDVAIDDAVVWLDAHRGEAAFGDPRICHFDFAPANVLWVRGGPPTVIDWDMAALGDPCCDVAFALEKLAIIPRAVPALARPVATALLGPAEDAFAAAYRARAEFDETRIRYWRALYCVLIQAWAAGLYVGDVGIRMSSANALSRRMTSVAAARFRELTS